MYKDKEVKELLELVDIHETLTFQSQLELQKELEARDLSAKSAALNSTIDQTAADIKNFQYLKDLGYKIEYVGNATIVSRTTTAVLIDIAAIVLGLVLSLYGFMQLLAITVLAPESDAGFSLNKVIMIVIYGMMILTGIKFLNGVKRFFDNLGFELKKSTSGIVLKKRFDLKVEERQVDAAAIQLEKYKDRMILKLDETDLLDANAKDIIQKMTIESMYQKLRS